jgi:hypothetical protein
MSNSCENTLDLCSWCARIHSSYRDDVNSVRSALFTIRFRLCSTGYTGYYSLSSYFHAPLRQQTESCTR